MIKKLALFIVLAFLVVPFSSMAQSPGKSSQNLSAADFAEDSIVVLSKDETGVPGYARQQVAMNCFGELQVIDYYGAPVDPKDRNVILNERRMCAKLIFGDDTDQD